MKNKKFRWVLAGVLAMILAVSLGQIVLQQLDYMRGDAAYEDAQQVAGTEREEDVQPPEPVEPDVSQSEPVKEPDPYFAALANTDLKALRETNDDVVGWIDIPGTVINYPIVQYSDNEYYLNHTWSGEWNSVGAIFLECKVSGDFSDFNTIIYGHRMNNQSMFGPLHNYKDQAYWEEHPSVYIVNDTGVHQYDIYAAFEPSVRDVVYGLWITDPAVKERVIRSGLDQSVIDTGVIPTADDQIITLSTCTGQGHETRWVVQAVLRADISLEDMTLN